VAIYNADVTTAAVTAWDKR